MGVSLTTVEALRAAHHDALHLRDEGLIRLPDPEIALKAAAEDRIVLTFGLDYGDILAAELGEAFSCRHPPTSGIRDPPADAIDEHPHIVIGGPEVSCGVGIASHFFKDPREPVSFLVARARQDIEMWEPQFKLT